MRVARLLFPAIRWDAEQGFDAARSEIDAALDHGVGGFCIFGGEAAAVRSLVTSLRARSEAPLLIGSDLERGAGQQFTGATPLPPLAALGAVGDLEATRAAANLTAREALALGVNWIFAPVADVDFEPENPIVGTRAFGADPKHVAAHVVEWINGCHDAGALCCAKHFPGHGRTVEDSHARLPVVAADRATLDLDLYPFRAAIDAHVDAIMTAHVSYPMLDAAGAPATLSQPIVTGLLRKEMDFGGLVVTDALIMEGVLHAGMDEPAAALMAVAAGCDGLLYPRDVEAVVDALEAASADVLPEFRVMEAIGRIDATAARAVADDSSESWGRAEDAAWVLDRAVSALVVVRGEPRCGRSVDVLTIDDDLGGPYPPPSRAPFAAALRDSGIDVRETASTNGQRDTLVSVYCDIRGWKGRPGLSVEAKRALAAALASQPAATVVLFGHPRLAADLAGNAVLSAWGGEAIMQEAAARWLAVGGAA